MTPIRALNQQTLEFVGDDGKSQTVRWPAKVVAHQGRRVLAEITASAASGRRAYWEKRVRTRCGFAADDIAC